MSAILFYLLLTKATITWFSGLASLPVLREDLVVHRRVITDAQLDASMVVSRTTPGPIGVYVVSVGYYADGIPGADGSTGQSAWRELSCHYVWQKPARICFAPPFLSASV